MESKPTHPRFQDLTKQRFGHLKVIAFAGHGRDTRGNSEVWWNCRCDCGNRVRRRTEELKNAGREHCGRDCPINRENITTRQRTHGKANTSTYSIWVSMRQRCDNPKNINFATYGARGISVCRRWTTFKNFLADMGERPARMTLDRKDSRKGYSRTNCRWATFKEQQRNRTNNRLITYDRRTQCLAAWAEETGISVSVLRCRLGLLHWSVSQALTTPVHVSRNAA